MLSAFWRGTGVRARALFCIALSIVCFAFVREATLVGDGHEYFSMVESFWRHGTPDQRADDIAAWVIWHRGPLPVVEMGERGATKIFTDAAGLDALAIRYDVEPSWLRSVRARGECGRFYLEPPAGAVVPRANGSRFVAYENGWYEHLGDGVWRWISERASLLVRGTGGGRRVRLSGSVPEVDRSAEPRVPLGEGLAHFESGTWLEDFDHTDGPVRCFAGPSTLRIDPDPRCASEELGIGVWVPNIELGRPSHLRVIVDDRVVHDGPVHTRWRRRLPLRSNEPHVVRFEPDRAVDTELGHAAACVEALRYLP
jgi:hypothetical protein